MPKYKTPAVNIRLTTLIYSTLVLLPLASSTAVATNQPTTITNYNQQQVAKALGWVREPKSKSLCRGTFKESPITLAKIKPTPTTKNLTTFSAKGPSELSLSGRSVLRGGVTVTQPGKQITADTAYIYRSQKTRRITRIDTMGNVHLRTPDHLIICQRGSLDLTHNVLTLHHLIYHLIQHQSTQTINGWGRAEKATRSGSKKITDLYRGSYSSCPPDHTPTWQIHAGHLHIDQHKQRVTAHNTWITVKGVPVLYTPYLSFSTSKQRKSGFLMPTFGYTSTSGAQIALPYYFNLAPNYAMTTTVTLYSRRGVLLKDLFQYLTKRSHGKLSVSFIPDDQEFASFKRSAPNDFSPSIPGVKHALRQLASDSNNRFALSYQNNTQYNAHWANAINLNYASDAYFYQDFGNNPHSQSTDQLLNQAQLNYSGLHWHFTGLLQAYQTLHTANNLAIANQYSSLPELDLNGDYPNQPGGLDYSVNSQFVYFDEANNFVTGLPVPTGARFHIDPKISLPITKTAGFFIPTLQLQTTAYLLRNPGSQITNPNNKNPDNPVRAIPVFDINTGLYFQRSLHLFKHHYEQILEPRLFYLYVPNINQNNLPLFDTVLPTFNFAQLFATNRFTGIDRIGDANQISLALINRIVDASTGQQKMSFGIGEMVLFQPHHVCLTASCSEDPTHNNTLSPIISQFTYNVNPHWRVVTNGSVDPYDQQLVNASAYVYYQNSHNRIVDLGYNYIRKGELLPTNSATTLNPVNNLNQLDVGFAWPIKQHWSILANLDYNFNRGHPLAYFGGIQYTSCCWAIRFIGSRTLIGETTNKSLQYDNTFYVQIQLRGLGSYGNNDPSSLLTSQLPGYVDTMQ